jgi:hypothetical protein
MSGRRTTSGRSCRQTSSGPAMGSPGCARPARPGPDAAMQKCRHRTLRATVGGALAAADVLFGIDWEQLRHDR